MQQISIYTRTGKLIKKVFGINDISLLRKNIHKKIGKLFFYRKYTAEEIVSVMKKMGMSRGSVICVHSSMKEFYNYKGTANELIDLILEEIGPDGTLVMPAFPKVSLRNQSGYVFDAINDPTGAGYLAEVFRKYPGVKRSINFFTSVCAIGKYADFLTKDHHMGHDCLDDSSPWKRMISLGAISFNLGMPSYYIGTFEHCVESVLQYDFPYWSQFFSEKKEYKYYNENRQICTYTNYTSTIEKRTHEKKVIKYFTKEEMVSTKISNLLIRAYYTDKCFPKMLELGKRGICIFYIPNPSRYHF